MATLRSLATGLVVPAGLLLVLAGCAGSGEGSNTSTSTTSTATSTTTQETSTSTVTVTTTPSTSTPTSTESTTVSSTPAEEQTAARVYFVRDEKVATAGRTVDSPGVAQGAMTALLEGTTAEEATDGMSSAIPEGTRLLSVDIDGTEARVDLSSEFENGGGSLSMQLRVAQVVFTLTQFDSVETVTILIDGQEQTDGIGGEGVPATDLDRVAVEGVVPFVLVESPVPGQTVTSPVPLAGWSNTFEATVLYTLTAADGTKLADGFTTATSGTGTWGTFSTDVSYPAASGSAVFAVGGENAETGGQADTYQVPVVLS
jgi:germination protein M